MIQNNPTQPAQNLDYSNNSYGHSNPQFMPEEKPFNWRKYKFLFVSNWYWFLITIGLALGITFYKIRYSVPKYRATATIILEEEENSQDILSGLRAIRYWRRQSDLANEKAKLRSFSMIKRSVDSLNQDVYWTAHGRIRERPLYNSPKYSLNILDDSVHWYKGKEWFIDDIDNTSYRFSRESIIDTVLFIDSTITIDQWRFVISLIGEGGHDTYSFVVNDPITLTKQFINKLEIESGQENGTVISLSSEGPVGEREVDFLNTLSQIYILSALERKQQVAENTFVFIDDQINVIVDSLKNAEQQLLLFRLTNNVINLSRDGELAYERLKSFHEQRTQLKLKDNYYAYLKKYIEDRNDPQTIIAPTLVNANDQLLIGAVQELQQFYEERENLDISVQKDNPSLESINTRISSVRLRIIEIINGLIENNQLTVAQLDIEEQAIIDQLQKLPLNEQELLNIRRKYDLYNQFYTFLLQKRAEAGIQKASTISNADILNRARYDQLISSGSDKKIDLFVALLLGILIPAVILFLKDLLDNRIRDREDIVNITEIPIIGIIGHARDVSKLPSREDYTLAFTESLRRIRTNLSFSLREKEKKVILVTSSISGEGKSFSAVNLASIIAMNKRKVLLIGCDLRRPSLHQTFNISNDTGLTSYIIGEKELKEVIIPTTIDYLSLLPAGPIPPNPAELIETPEINSLFETARKEFDYIIIDTPPVALVSDALAIATHVDLTLYVVRQDFSHKRVLEVANTLKMEQKLPNLYLLINDIPAKRNFGFNYYYGYEKGYSYGYYYKSE